jgi:glycine cleavage system H protein
MIKYTKTHEWIKIESDDTATAGVTDFAVEQLGDIVFLELPKADAELSKGSPFGAIESVKAVFDLNSPVSGKVLKVNESLNSDLEILKKSPVGEGWMIKIKLANKDELSDLMDEAAYKEYLKTAEGGQH